MKKWEYEVMKMSTPLYANELTGIAWELCGVIQFKDQYWYYLKREIV